MKDLQYKIGAKGLIDLQERREQLDSMEEYNRKIILKERIDLKDRDREYNILEIDNRESTEIIGLQDQKDLEEIEFQIIPKIKVNL